MKVKDIQDCLEAYAPVSLQESYDNSGLLVGSPDDEVTGVLISLDMTEAIVDEAIAKGCSMVVSHHPIIFSGLKRLNGSNYIERTVIKAIKNDIALYAIHTNLDNVSDGVNAVIAKKLGLENLQILAPKSGQLLKLVTFCPSDHAENVRTAMCNAGAGRIGEYDYCSFSASGEGTFRAGKNTNAYVGKKGEIHKEAEVRIELVLPKYAKLPVIKALLKSHPYEEVAYDIYDLKNTWAEIGSGMVGDLPQSMPTMDFLKLLKTNMKAGVVRYTDMVLEKVQRVAVCGGSGSFLLPNAKAAKADIFITADYKYHQFFDAEGDIVIADIGHYESEQFTKELLQGILRKKFPTFALVLAEVNTNPINYL
ncbi:MAG: dinuclear metal center YbgI/SA1388 family protein [Flavobacteriales bacterium]|jgi:dinuclear metal center YbgI/SA1388 family protein